MTTLTDIKDVLVFFRTRVLNCEGNDHVRLELEEAETILDGLTEIVRAERAPEQESEPEPDDGGRYYIENPGGRFAVARWDRNDDVAGICRCILGTLKYEPHSSDVTPLRRLLENLIATSPSIVSTK